MKCTSLSTSTARRSSCLFVNEVTLGTKCVVASGSAESGAGGGAGGFPRLLTTAAGCVHVCPGAVGQALAHLGPHHLTLPPAHIFNLIVHG